MNKLLYLNFDKVLNISSKSVSPSKLQSKVLDCILQSGYIYRLDVERKNAEPVDEKKWYKWYDRVDHFEYLIYPIQL